MSLKVTFGSVNTETVDRGRDSGRDRKNNRIWRLNLSTFYMLPVTRPTIGHFRFSSVRKSRHFSTTLHYCYCTLCFLGPGSAWKMLETSFLFWYIPLCFVYHIQPKFNVQHSSLMSHNTLIHFSVFTNRHQSLVILTSASWFETCSTVLRDIEVLCWTANFGCL
jgi:hypothetical protein